MSTREQLLEQYEEAQFALLMDRIMEQQGIRAEELNRALRQDPAAAVPSEVREHSLQTITDAFDRQDKRKNRRILRKTLRTLLIAAALTSLLLSTVSADFRLAAKNFVYELTELAAELMFDFGDGADHHAPEGEVILGYFIPALPEEFELVESSENVNSAWRHYESESGLVMINISDNDGSGIGYHIDTENGTTEYERINQFDVLIVQNANSVQLVLSDKEQLKHIEITSTALSVDDLRKYIAKIKYS